MQVDFTNCSPEVVVFSGWLEKKGSVRKNWKKRFFKLSDGVLKYYNKETTNDDSSDIKGEVLIIGAIVTQSEGIQLHITNKNDKKHSHTFTLRAKNSSEANSWNDALCSEIERINIIAIQNGSRIPEVVEWYYQHQSEVVKRNAFLSNEVLIDLHYAVLGRLDAQSVTKFNVTMTSDKQGLLMRIANHNTGKKFNRIESINNGRVLLFSDLIGVYLPGGTWEVPPASPFAFTLMTSEDQLSLEIAAEGCGGGSGPNWLLAVQDMATFSHIPKPISRSMSSIAHDRVSMDGGGHNTGLSDVDLDYEVQHYNQQQHSSNINAIFEFSSNSGQVFASSSDVQLIIEGLSALSAKCPAVVEIGRRINVVLKLIPDMKSNKEAALNFGDRLEEFTRVLGDPDSGILYVAGEWDKTLLNFHLGIFSNKLNDVALYLHTQSQPGWLATNLSRPNETAKLRLEQFDADLSSILNTLNKAMSLPASMLFERKVYSMAVDVRKSVDALGGVEAVYRDVAKERALARLVQADGHDIASEVQAIMRAEGITSRSHGQRHQSGSFSSYQSSIDRSERAPVSCFQRYVCCCLQKNKSSNSKAGRRSNIQLEEPLV